METRINHAPRIYRSKNKKKRIKVFLTIIGILLLCYLALFLLILPERPERSFFQQDKPLVVAHKGGAELAPENTLVAFEKAQTLGVDVINYQVHMTKDGQLVVIHDETVDRTTNGKGMVDEMTLEELKKLDAAYTFKDIRGRYIYRGQKITVPTVAEVLQSYEDIRHHIELKKPTEKEVYPEIEQKLWQLIKNYNMQEKVLFSSYSEESIAEFNKLAKGSVALTGTPAEAREYVVYHKLFIGRLFKPQTDALQLEAQSRIFNLIDSRIIDGGDKFNLQLLYKAVDDEQLMRELLDNGVDGIITDKPDLLIRVLNEMGEL